MDGGHGEIDVLLDVLGEAVGVTSKTVAIVVIVLVVEILGVEEALGLLDGAIELNPVVAYV